MRLIVSVIFSLLFAVSALAADKTYTVSGDSMSPALLSGDIVVVRADPSAQVSKGDLAAIRFKHTTTPMVKRIVAVEGDLVEIKEDAIVINSEKIREIDMSRWQTTAKQLERYGWMVPAGNLLALGDNPDNSLDSRRLGLISTDQIEGRVIRVIKKKGPGDIQTHNVTK